MPMFSTWISVYVCVYVCVCVSTFIKYMGQSLITYMHVNVVSSMLHIMRALQHMVMYVSALHHTTSHIHVMHYVV